MTEHQLQEQLTARWIHDPPKITGLGEPTLLAWEVMFPSWKINDKWTGFGEPAVDFIFLTTSSDVVLVELKVNLTPVKFLKSLCQVSHQAILFADTYSPERLMSAFSACKAGAKRRAFDGGLSHEIIAQRIIRVASDNSSLRIIRVIAAPKFPKKANDILTAFNNSSHAEVISSLISKYKSDRMFKRFVTILPDAFHAVSMEPIILLTIEPAK